MKRVGFFETTLTTLQNRTNWSKSELVRTFIAIIISIAVTVVLLANTFYERDLTSEEITEYKILGSVLWENGIQDMYVKEAEISTDRECNLADIYTYPLNSVNCRDIKFKITLGDGTRIERKENKLTFITPKESGSPVLKKLTIDFSNTSEDNITMTRNQTIVEYIAFAVVIVCLGFFEFAGAYFLLWVLERIINALKHFVEDYKRTKAELIEEKQEEQKKQEPDEENEGSGKTVGELFKDHQEVVKKVSSNGKGRSKKN